MNPQLLVTIVPRDQGELVTSATLQAGAAGGTIALGRGTATNALLQLLGLGDTSKDITLTLAEQECIPALIDAVQTATSGKNHFGLLFTLPADRFFRSGDTPAPLSTGDSAMTTPSKYRLLNVIVNKGFAEDAMAAARKAGANGGTILNGRGTAREGDAKFLGVQIVPEKEILLILVDSEKADRVLLAIRDLPCFAEKGSGIAYSLPVDEFALLGK